MSTTPLHTPGWHAEEFRAPDSLVETDYFELELRGNVARQRGPAFAKLFGFCALFLLAGWAALTSIYILLHDDLLSASVLERHHMQAGYEQRIAGLRGEIGIITGQLMLNEDQFDIKVNRIRQRQTLLESRQNHISELVNDPRLVRATGIADQARGDITGSTAPAREQVSENPLQNAQGGPLGPGIIRLSFSSPSGLRTVSRLPFTSLGETGLPLQPQNRADIDLMLLVSNQNKMETEQFAALTRMEEDAEAAIQLVSSTITRIGFSPRSAIESLNAIAPIISPEEPPLVQVAPMPIASRNNFDLQLQRVRTRLGQAEALYRAVLQYPVRRPLSTSHAITSRYGSRRDPFHHRLAFHGGVDFRAESGVPVRATADGVVVKASYSGGYGRLVEISHGFGLSTRYAHMSSISVRLGEQISAGDVIGKVGSSGRSTGPHLHYEVRRGGNSVDPLRMLRVGDEILVN